MQETTYDFSHYMKKGGSITLCKAVKGLGLNAAYSWPGLIHSFNNFKVALPPHLTLALPPSTPIFVLVTLVYSTFDSLVHYYFVRICRWYTTLYDLLVTVVDL